ncbi:MAG: hypothetical protein AVDCRST_MAG96-3998 [uncultured Segetibacter sp.]|uniref:Uncharacterized protein n=1 Tax=uncultured Segetibacter sp. TaxID=481133 RepID=A0A6J4U3D3_9BACT|nr:MAG: hypothetical protein AVDCRST_MAG96-3998 [uncultured Segetibacter sp.]
MNQQQLKHFEGMAFFKSLFTSTAGNVLNTPAHLVYSAAIKTVFPSLLRKIGFI